MSTPVVCRFLSPRCCASGTCHFPAKHEDVVDVERCEMHTMGHSGMVLPLVRFILNATKAEQGGGAP